MAVPTVASDKKSALEGIITGHIVPRYEALEAATGNLSKAVIADCGDETPGDPASRAAFRTALLSWHSIQHIRFGPVTTDNRQYRFEYWPDKHGQGARQVRKLLSAGLAEIPSAVRIGKSSVAIQGFPALERVLYGTTSDAAAACALAVSISANLNVMSANILREWSSWQPGSVPDVGKLLARNLADQLDVMAGLKLVRPLGDSLETARPRRAEHWRSSLSYAALSANFDGLYGLFTGESSQPGLRAWVIAGGGPARQADQLAEHLQYGSTFVGWQKPSLHDAVSDREARDKAAFLVTHVRYTEELVKSVVYPALGVAAGFNSQDGD
ncbi:MAG: imelysin family protein [Anderseniella sp.]